MKRSVHLCLWVLLVAVTAYAADDLAKEPQFIQQIRAHLPDNWLCEVRCGETNKHVPHGLKAPVFQLMVTNPVFCCKFTIVPTNESATLYKESVTLFPNAQFCFYLKADKAEILSIIEKEKIFSWNVPIYFGEAGDYIAVTSPVYVNEGNFNLEARRALNPMWKVLREFIPNPEPAGLDEMAGEK